MEGGEEGTSGTKKNRITPEVGSPGMQQVRHNSREGKDVAAWCDCMAMKAEKADWWRQPGKSNTFRKL
eukprot:1161147-Pelagomonas_calceolata.AAC.7